MATKQKDGPTFTLLFDPIVKQYGLTGAAIYGSVYRFSKMRNEFCYASQETIAAMVGLKRKAANIWLKILVDDGYIIEKENTNKYSTKIYVPSDKLDKLSAATKNYKNTPTKVEDTHLKDDYNFDF
jgi:hypothetical protein